MMRNRNQMPATKIVSGFLVVMSALFFFVLLAGSVWAKGESQLIYEAEGKSSVKNNDYSRGRARAVDYAFKNALTVALQDLLSFFNACPHFRFCRFKPVRTNYFSSIQKGLL